jgi:hypothetical protein
MTSLRWTAAATTLIGLLALTAADGLGQPPDQKDFFQKKGFGGPFGGGERKIVKDHDRDGDGRLNTDERAAARAALKTQGGGKGGFGMKMGFGKGGEPGRPGPTVAPSEVKNYPNAALYEGTVLRTLFLEFENKDWETELQDFHGTDVEVPCTLTVDGKKYPNVGVHFRGMSSYGGVPAGSKRSMNLSVDFADKKQRLSGAKTLNLLNAHEDASFLSTVLYSHIARQYLPAPKANVVKVVINGESWGLYVNVQQFDKEFLEENFKTDKGARWKVRGSPGGGGGLEYLGENVADYKRRYEIKTKDDDKSWKALINLCKVLNQTPPDRLEAALRPIMDVDSLLWFLALDITLINNDGYWIRASDYSLYLDAKGKFHVVPHDMNESFRPGGGPGFGGMRVMGRPGEVLPLPLQDMIGLTAEQKKKLADLQKETDDKLGKIFNEEQNKQWKQLREGGPVVFGPGGFGPPPGGPGGFGPPPGGPPGGPGAPPGGPGGPGGFGPPGGGPGGSGVEIDPLYGLTDSRKPLRSKVLAVPALRAKYLANVKTIAEDALDWKRLGPVVAMYRALIEKDVQADTRKLESFEAFQRMTADVADANARGRSIPLRAFADQRRKYLLAYQEPAKGK